MSQETRPLQELNQIFPISEVIPENILKTIQNAEFGTDLSRRLDFGKFESEQLIADIVESSVRAGRWQGTIIDTTIEDPHNLQQSIHAFFRHLAENRVLGYKEGIERLINNNWASIVFHNGKLALVPTPDGITKLKNQFDTSIRFVTANPPPDKKQAHAAPAEDEVNMIIETFLRETQLTEQINERIENFSPDEKNTYQRMLHYFQLDNQVDVATAESIFYELFDSDDYSPQEKKSLDDVFSCSQKRDRGLQEIRKTTHAHSTITVSYL
ncbi:hypothetical protein LRY60_03610 [Candidatus Woesebacteria bacterium]|nr:hypothetical protein [Candidatus Woesebacteria bacterium]